MHHSNWTLALTYALLNLPFYVAQFDYVLRRAIFNYDYFLPLILSTISRKAAFGLLTILQGLDFFVSNATQYHFKSPYDFFQSLFFADEINLLKLFSPRSVLLILMLLTLNWWCLKVVSQRTNLRHSILAVTIAAALLGVADFCNGSSGVKRADIQYVGANIAGTSIANLLSSFSISRSTENVQIPSNNSLIGQAEVMEWIRNHPDGNVILVIVESLGLHSNAAVNKYLADTLVSDLDTAYYTNHHIIPFFGSTTYAELRELCSERGSYHSISDPAKCVPHMLQSLGWKTVGVHNFSGRMFDRNLWWRDIGIRERWFSEELYRVSPTVCDGAFRGPCDETNIMHIFSHLDKSKQFLYGLTVNAHLPLLDTKIDINLLKLCANFQLAHADCSLIEMHRRVLLKINSEMRQYVLKGRRALVLVVGDHSPPFGDQKLRTVYSEGFVPGFSLRPRD